MTVTGTWPAACAGVVKVIVVPDRVNARWAPPNVTVIVAVNPYPARVTVVPPTMGPNVGEIENRYGAVEAADSALEEAIPTTGAWSGLPPIEPSKAAEPKLKTPPSDPASQYPPPSGVAAIETMGAWSGLPPIDPSKVASPKLKMPPSLATSQ